jgi:hypothetical protein
MNMTDTPLVIVRSIRFSLSRWDVLRCRLWVVAHNWKLVTIILGLCLAAPALTYQTPEGKSFSLGFCAFYFCIMAVLVLVLNIAFQIVFQTFWLFANKNRGVVGEHEFEIRDEGFWEKTPFNESLHRWAGFHKIYASRNFLFVFVTDNIVHYIPLRAFASKEDAESFRAELQRRAHAV